MDLADWLRAVECQDGPLLVVHSITTRSNLLLKYILHECNSIKRPGSLRTSTSAYVLHNAQQLIRTLSWNQSSLLEKIRIPDGESKPTLVERHHAVREYQHW